MLLGSVPCFLILVSGHFYGLLSYLKSLNLPFMLVLYSMVLFVIFFEMHRQQSNEVGRARMNRLMDRFVTFKAISQVGEGALGIYRGIAGSLFVVGIASMLIDVETLEFVMNEAVNGSVSEYVFGSSSVAFSIILIFSLAFYQFKIDMYKSLASGIANELNKQ